MSIPARITTGSRYCYLNISSYAPFGELLELKTVELHGISLGSVATVELNSSAFTKGFDGILGMNAFQDEAL